MEDVARHFWVSQSTITQVFRNKLGASFYRCVTQRRLIAAKNRILEGAALETVAEEATVEETVAEENCEAAPAEAVEEAPAEAPAEAEVTAEA